MNDSQWDAARIKYLRKALHLSQHRFALLLGITRDAVANWENDRRHPDRFLVPRLTELEDQISKEA